LSNEISNHTITLISASKTFNIAGLKSSAVIITNPVLREQFQSKLRGFAGSTNILGETAMRAAYQTGEDWLKEFIKHLDKNRSLLVDYVNHELPGINIYPPEGTFLGWLDCSGTALADPADHFLKMAKVALNSGTWFGEDYKMYSRINFACHQNVLLAALDRIKKSLNL
jgi:cystathionine beta-lyase